jgi:aconitate hydratase
MKSNSFKSMTKLQLNNCSYYFHSLSLAAANGLGNIDLLPFSIKILLENLLRKEDGNTVQRNDIETLAHWQPQIQNEIFFSPTRVLMQDFTGVPAIVDLAAMRDAVVSSGGDPALINPQIPVDLVIDHSVMVDHYGKAGVFEANVKREMERNHERYAFLRWGQNVFDNFRVVPPGTGICHQVNLEYLAQVVWVDKHKNETWIYPDTLVGTDSHTTMINGLGILGWGVGGIEAEAAMLGQPISMLIPEVVGFHLTGSLREGVTATDLVLSVTQMLRQHGVVGKFVEFFGTGLSHLPLADRATIANMAPEYGATCGFFPIDEITLNYLSLTGRSAETVKLVETYCKEQGLWRTDSLPDPQFSAIIELNLESVSHSLAGPKRPQDRVKLEDLRKATEQIVPEKEMDKTFPVSGCNYHLKHGNVVIAAITSCTNTSNPTVMMAAGLLAKKAVKKGLLQKPWVKTSLAPGSKVVTDYLAKAGLQEYLDKIGFNLVGYGCTTCIGNSGPLNGPITESIDTYDLTVCSVLSGNRNFEGRVHTHTKASWLASPPLVVVFALTGTTCIDLSCEPIGIDHDGLPVYLKDIWPSNTEVAKMLALVNYQMFRKGYSQVFNGDESWKSLPIPEGLTYKWQHDSTYIRPPSFFDRLEKSDIYPGIENARPLAIFGDSFTTDHISPAGAINAISPAGNFLKRQGVEENEFNSYGSRRGNYEVMVRGTFANIRLRNKMVWDKEGGYTKLMPDGEEMSIFDAATKYSKRGIPLVVIAGKEYGTGSSRDWAAKGPLLLGVKVVLAESFERIHRSNLVGMGILPIQFILKDSVESLKLDGSEEFSLSACKLSVKMELKLTIKQINGQQKNIAVICRLDTDQEVKCFQSGGILNHVLLDVLE